MFQINQIFKEQFSNINLIFRLAFYEIKGSFAMHYLGGLWEFINPAIQILIYWVVFGIGIRGGKPIGDTPYIAWLVVGIIPWFFINPTITQGANSIYARLNLVSKMKFPLSTLPLITIIGNSFNFFSMYIIQFLIFIVYGIKPNIYYLQLPYYLFCLYVFLFAATLFFSTFSTIVRDLHSLLQTAMKMLFYITPVFWDAGNFPTVVQNVFKLNPIYYLIKGFRDTFLFKTWFFEDLTYTFYFWIITITILLIGSTLHLKLRKSFVDYL